MQPVTTNRLLRLPAVIHRVGYSRPSIYRKIALGEFPRPVSLGGTSDRSAAVAWRESDIDAWIASRVEVGSAPSRR